MTNAMLGTNPDLLNHWSQNNNPMGRLGRTDEVRGVTVSLPFELRGPSER